MSSDGKILDTISMPDEEIVPGYRVLTKLGEGAFGEVFAASGPGDVHLALKIVDLGTRAGRTEFAALDRIKHLNCPNMVSISGLWLKDSTGRVLDRDELLLASDAMRTKRGTLPASAVKEPTYRPPLKLIIAMSKGEGTLRDRLQECLDEGLKGIPPDELLRYMADAARAIDFLASPSRGDAGVAGGMQHGDIKPANMLLVANGNAVQLCDYGLARVLSDGQRTAFAGTVAYSAPESFKTRLLSTAADQYALAVSYVELRTGRLPFPDDSSLAQLMQMHCEGNLDISGLEPAEQAVIKRATSVDPEKRYPTSGEMVKALREAWESRPAPGARRRRAMLALAIIGLLATAGAAAGLIAQWLSRLSDFDLAPVEQSLAIHAGDSKAVRLQVQRTNFAGPIEYQWLDLPEGVYAPPGEHVLDAPGELMLTVDVKAPATPQPVPIRLRATSGDLVRLATLELNVLPVNAWLPPGRDDDYHAVAENGFRRIQGRMFAERLECEKEGVRLAFLLVVPPGSEDKLPFYISENKVTNDVFARFAAAFPEAVDRSRWKEGGEIDHQPIGNADAPQYARLPVFNVTWQEADRCAQWLGGRLPTARQWDLAAGLYSGDEGPYRGEWTLNDLTKRPRIAVDREHEGPLNVDAETDDISPAGCRHMSGNGYEWTRTTDNGDDLPLAKPSWSKFEIRLRGRGYGFSRPYVFSDTTFAVQPPTKAEPITGFRIVLDDLFDPAREPTTP